jgi:oligopeptide/dipeptide ABC transporter ATP-binding protein
MARLQRERNLTYVFISHDLSVVEHVSDTIAIMYLGRIVEKGPVERIFQKPAHPYTRALIEAIPVPDPRQRHASEPLQGEAPSPVSPPPGCPFHPRCPYAIEACRVTVPQLEHVGAPNPDPAREHLAACIRKDEI